MGRFLKFLLIGLGAIAGLLVLLVLAVALLFDPNDYKEEIAARVEAATGRSLTLEGDLELGVFPWLSVDTGRVVLGNAEGFGPEPFAELDGASVAIRLWPLLRREIEIGNIDIDGLALNLRVAGDGQTNWDDLAAEPAAGEAAPEEGDGGIGDLSVAGFSLTDAIIDWRDAAAGAHYRVTGLNLTSGSVAPGEPVDLDAGFTLETLPEGPSGTFAMAAVATVDPAAGTVSLQDLEFEGELTPGADMPAIDVGLSAATLGLDTDRQTLQLDGAAAELATLRMELNLAGTIGEAMRLDGRIEVPRFSPKDLAAALEAPLPPTADPGVLEQATFSGDVRMTDDSFALSGLRATLDDTGFTGEFSVDDFAAPAYRFTLTGDRIDVDRYLAPPAADAPAEADAAELDATEIPVELLRSLDAQGSVKMTELLLGGVTFRNIELGVNAGGGVLRLHPISARVFDGGYRGDVRIDASDAVPRLTVDENVEGVQLAALGREILETDRLSGSLEGRFALAGSGNNLAEIRRDLGGDIRFELSDGAFEGTDLWHQIRRARALFRREAPPEPPAEPRTPFSTVRGTAVVEGGVLRNDDLFAELPFLRVTGAGEIDLAAATLDYGVSARVMEKPEFVGEVSERELSEYTEAVIPIRITGSLSDPSIRPDVEEMVREEVKGRIEEETKRLERRLLDKLGIGSEEDGDEPTEEDQLAPGDEPAEEEESLEDELKNTLKDLLGN